MVKAPPSRPKDVTTEKKVPEVVEKEITPPPPSQSPPPTAVGSTVLPKISENEDDEEDTPPPPPADSPVKTSKTPPRPKKNGGDDDQAVEIEELRRKLANAEAKLVSVLVKFHSLYMFICSLLLIRNHRRREVTLPMVYYEKQSWRNNSSVHMQQS